MFETLSTIELTVAASIVVALLRMRSRGPRFRASRSPAFSASGSSSFSSIGASGALDPAHGLGVPALGLTVGLPVASLLFAFRGSLDPERHAGDAFAGARRGQRDPNFSPRAFCGSLRAGRLPAPFAPSAGWGDIIAGVAALPLAWSIASLGSRMRALALGRNTLGIADLISAVALGALSSPARFRSMPDRQQPP